MSDPTVPDLPDADVEPRRLKRFLEALREIVQTREGRRGNILDQSVTWRELLGWGLIAKTGPSRYSGVVDAIPGPPGPPGPEGPPGSDPPDLTAPPNATGLTVTAGFSTLFVEWDEPSYTEGHGPGYVEVWAAQNTGTAPVFTAAQIVSKEIGTIFAFAAGLGKTYHFWIKNVTHDGVAQTTPTGGPNGVSGTTTKIGTTDLTDLLVTAGKIADGSVTAAKILGGAVDASKLAVTIGGGNALVNSSFEVDSNADGLADGWSVYTLGTVGSASSSIDTALVAHGAKSQKRSATALGTSSSDRIGLQQSLVLPDVVGKTAILSGSLAASASAKVAVRMVFKDSGGGVISPQAFSPHAASTGALERKSVSAVVPAGTVTIGCYAYATERPTGGACDFHCDAMQFEFADVLTAYAPKPDEILAGSIGTTAIADDAITTPKIVAGAIVAGKIAANAVGANEIAAGSITTNKLVVAGAQALNNDPRGSDSTAWTVYSGGANLVFASGVTDIPGGGSTALQNAAGTKVVITSELIPLDQNRNYRLKASLKQTVGTNDKVYLGVHWWDANGVQLAANVEQPTGAGSPAGWASNGVDSRWQSNINAPAAWTEYTAAFGPDETAQIPSNARFFSLSAILNNGATASSVILLTGYSVKEKSDYDMIVDGAIMANHLAANSIAVGTAAIENGAIVNAMIGSAAIDSAKIASLSVATANIANAAITTAKIANLAVTNAQINDLNAAKIDAGYLSASRIAAASIDATKLSVSNLAAITADMGAITAGTLTLNTSGHVKGGQTAYDTGTGFFLGYSGAAYKLSIGSATRGLLWNGSDLVVRGDIIANGNIVSDAVTTDKISDGAIRAFASATASSPVSYSSWTAILTASPAVDVGSTGKVGLITTINFINGYSAAGENDSGSQSTPEFRLKRGSTVLATWQPALGSLVASRGTTSYTYVDTPGSGSYAYSLEMRDSSGLYSLAVAENRSLSALGVKK